MGDSCHQHLNIVQIQIQIDRYRQIKNQTKNYGKYNCKRIAIADGGSYHITSPKTKLKHLILSRSQATCLKFGPNLLIGKWLLPDYKKHGYRECSESRINVMVALFKEKFPKSRRKIQNREMKFSTFLHYFWSKIPVS